MEKVVCALWRDPGEPREQFNARLLKSLATGLARAGASRIRINLRDAAVAPAAELVQQWQNPQQDAVVQFWLPSANALFRGVVDGVLADHCARFAAWLVCESTVIANTTCARQTDGRTPGWAQASFITFRSDMDHAAAMAHWHGHHTRVAIETQANFEYVQNAVVRPLTQDAPAYDAFVEECFPAGAMTDPATFFAAQGDPDRLRSNVAAMMDSCRAFLDFSRNDIIPTSQYDCDDASLQAPMAAGSGPQA